MWKVKSFNPKTNEIVTEHVKGKRLKFVIPENTDKKLYLDTLMQIQSLKESKKVIVLFAFLILQSFAILALGFHVLKLY